jgi:hypothetical protein
MQQSPVYSLYFFSHPVIGVEIKNVLEDLKLSQEKKEKINYSILIVGYNTAVRIEIFENKLILTSFGGDNFLENEYKIKGATSRCIHFVADGIVHFLSQILQFLPQINEVSIALADIDDFAQIAKILKLFSQVNCLNFPSCHQINLKNLYEMLQEFGKITKLHLHADELSIDEKVAKIDKKDVLNLKDVEFEVSKCNCALTYLIEVICKGAEKLSLQTNTPVNFLYFLKYVNGTDLTKLKLLKHLTIGLYYIDPRVYEKTDAKVKEQYQQLKNYYDVQMLNLRKVNPTLEIEEVNSSNACCCGSIVSTFRLC